MDADENIIIGPKKRIALVAHDNKKRHLLEWAKYNRLLLLEHELYSTGTTGKMLEDELEVTISKFRSGPLGGVSRSAQRSQTAKSIS